MQQLHDLYKKVLEQGVHSDDRTGVGTIKLVGETMRFNLQEGFPATTTKRFSWKAMASELLWFVEGSHDERRLAEILYGTRDWDKKTIWTANAEADYWKPKAKYPGDLGRVYGVQWRTWQTPGPHWNPELTASLIGIKTTDQIYNLINNLKTDPSCLS